ncbi:MAG: PIG-L deacetylase family protein [Chloroflexota bacterium]|nr:PIG-L deacetylase family protein [Chloroflexota bacterium]
MDVALFLSPHTDDAELGAGGTIAKMAETTEVHVVAFSDASDTQHRTVPSDTLKKETMKAMRILGIDQENISILSYRTRHFWSSRQEILDSIINLRDRIRPNIIFAPSTHDKHQDHQVIVNEVLRAFKGSSTTILGYEQPWNNFSFESTCFIKLDESHVDKKVRALEMYTSQSHRPYLNEEFIRGLASVRGTQMGGGYAEAFEAMRVVIH